MTSRTPREIESGQSQAEPADLDLTRAPDYSNLTAFPGAVSLLAAAEGSCPDPDLLDLVRMEVSELLGLSAPSQRGSGSKT